jgi:type II secretory pathway component GspD/PulD (secretin)
MAAVLVLCLPVWAAAQAEPEPIWPDRYYPRISHNNADVREVVRALFSQLGIPYSLDPAIQGRISLDLKNTSFGEVMRVILKKFYAVCTADPRGYHIVKRKPSQTPVKVPNALDSERPTNIRIGRIEFRRTPIHTVLVALFLKAKVSFSVDPEVIGKVDVHLKNPTLGEALRASLSQVQATYLVEGGIVNVVSTLPLNRNVSTHAQFLQDPRFLYVLSDLLYKLDKRTLRIVSTSHIPGPPYVWYGPGIYEQSGLPKPPEKTETRSDLVESVEPEAGAPAKRQVLQDGSHLYILTGRYLYKVRKSNLSLVARAVLRPPWPR